MTFTHKIILTIAIFFFFFSALFLAMIFFGQQKGYPMSESVANLYFIEMGISTLFLIIAAALLLHYTWHKRK